MDKFLSMIAGAVLAVVGTSTSPVIMPMVAQNDDVGKIVATTTVKDLVAAHIEKTFPDDKRLMKKIASCESGMLPTAKSKTSSASGVFQIIKGTWKLHECEGDPLDYKDNIACAKKIYDGGQGLGAWSESFKCWVKTN